MKSQSGTYTDSSGNGHLYSSQSKLLAHILTSIVPYAIRVDASKLISFLGSVFVISIAERAEDATKTHGAKLDGIKATEIFG